MRRSLLVITGIGAGVLMACLLLLNANAMLQSLETERYTFPSMVKESAADFPEEVHFPYVVTGTNLVVEQVAAYDGPYLEDGSNQEVFNVTAIVLRNAGATGVVSAQITMEQGDRRLEFEAETLPPGQAVLIIEKSKNEYIQKTYNACYGEQELATAIWWAKNAPKIEPVGMSSLAVTNTGEYSLEEIWLYYKTYQREPGIYIGGITYKVGIRRLEPGQTLQINPPFFVNGYSRIARITTG